MFNIVEVKKDEKNKIFRENEFLKIMKDDHCKWLVLEVTSDEAVDKSFYTEICAQFNIIVLAEINEYKKILLGSKSSFLALVKYNKAQVIFGKRKEFNEELSAFLTNLKARKIFKCNNYELETQEKTNIIGILNITNDSFFDGGKYFDMDSAIKHAYDLIEEGADIIEIGGQSFRPDYKTISVEEELKRVIPVLKALKKEIKVPISIDTAKFEVAKNSLYEGADIINCVMGLNDDERTVKEIAKYDAGVVIMHNQKGNKYKNLVEDIFVSLKDQVETAQANNIANNRIMVDPGVGYTFGKNYEQIFTILNNIEYFNNLGVATLLAHSRKTFIGDCLHLDTDARLIPTIALSAYAICKNVNFLRVHDVKETKQIVTLMDKVKSSFEN